MIRMLLAFLVVFVLGGCSTLTEQQSSTQFEVHKGAPVVFIHPLNKQIYAQSSVGIVPFAIPGNMDTRLGVRAAVIFRDIMLGKQSFHRVKMLSGHYGNGDEAIQAGRLGKVDLVLAGRINYAMEGTEMGGARLDVTVRLLNVVTGKTVWHIEQAMDQPLSYPKTDMLHSIFNAMTPPITKRPNGAPVLVNMLAQSAVDMADVMVGVMYVRR